MCRNSVSTNWLTVKVFCAIFEFIDASLTPADVQHYLALRLVCREWAIRFAFKANFNRCLTKVKYWEDDVKYVTWGALWHGEEPWTQPLGLADYPRTEDGEILDPYADPEPWIIPHRYGGHAKSIYSENRFAQTMDVTCGVCTVICMDV